MLCLSRRRRNYTSGDIDISGKIVISCYDFPAYTVKEWKKIEKLVAEKGKIYKSPSASKKHIKSL